MNYAPAPCGRRVLSERSDCFFAGHASLGFSNRSWHGYCLVVDQSLQRRCPQRVNLEIITRLSGFANKWYRTLPLRIALDRRCRFLVAAVSGIFRALPLAPRLR